MAIKTEREREREYNSLLHKNLHFTIECSSKHSGIDNLGSPWSVFRPRTKNFWWWPSLPWSQCDTFISFLAVISSSVGFCLTSLIFWRLLRVRAVPWVFQRRKHLRIPSDGLWRVFAGCRSCAGLGSWSRKYVRGVRACFNPQNVTFFHSKLLLDNSAAFTSPRMKDLRQKWKVKLLFRGACRTFVNKFSL